MSVTGVVKDNRLLDGRAVRDRILESVAERVRHPLHLQAALGRVDVDGLRIRGGRRDEAGEVGELGVADPPEVEIGAVPVGEHGAQAVGVGGELPEDLLGARQVRVALEADPARHRRELGTGADDALEQRVVSDLGQQAPDALLGHRRRCRPEVERAAEDAECPPDGVAGPAPASVLGGALEGVCAAGMADAIVDLRETGRSLAENRLHTLAEIAPCEALFVHDGDPDLDDLAVRIGAVLAARRHRYVMLHIAPERVGDLAGLFPGLASPTVLPLAGRDDLVAVHLVTEAGSFWSRLQDLRNLGATGIVALRPDALVD